jgi:hypothetical protein
LCADDSFSADISILRHSADASIFLFTPGAHCLRMTHFAYVSIFLFTLYGLCVPMTHFAYVSIIPANSGWVFPNASAYFCLRQAVIVC